MARLLLAVGLLAPLRTAGLVCIDAGSDWIKMGVMLSTSETKNGTKSLRMAMAPNERGERKWPALVGHYESLTFSDDSMRLLTKGLHPGTVVGHVKEELGCDSHRRPRIGATACNAPLYCS